MFGKILIANRGEIACRIIRTAKRLGVGTVAVYSRADAAARHVALADEAVEIGPAPARESYLRGDVIIAAAQRTGAEAIHPGYGFLSENAGFAEACASAGLVFIGPRPAAIRAMGNKSAAKALMAAAGVPVVPGYHGASQADALLQNEADRIGYPVLIKAAAGGGGKGMRVVTAPGEFAACLAAARREAQSAFGDQDMLVEKYLVNPRHIEVQVFGDSHGNFAHLFERDCSVQRRHQKIIEEAPAPGMTAERRAEICATAVTAARAVGYLGAGTVEFIVDGAGSFYFMEMNTRLQVEHPVTELITGLDLVEWQLTVAAGGPLPLRQEELRISGHAMEARLYAEDPERDFLPATGHLAHLRFPADSKHLRVDSGVQAGDAVTIHYDPMIAKLIVWDMDRRGALRRLQALLRDTEVVGVRTNLEFLATVAGHEAFASGAIDTGFIDRHREELLALGTTPAEGALAIAALDVLLRRQARARQAAAASADPNSPWHGTGGWRLAGRGEQRLVFLDNGAECGVTAYPREDGWELRTSGGTARVSGWLEPDGELTAIIDGRRNRVAVVREDDTLTILHRGQRHRLQSLDPAARAESQQGAGGGLTAPMPGRIVAVHVSKGQAVRRGDPLIVLEAMKMEHTVAAPADGVVTELLFAAGDLVEEGARLLVLG